MADHEADEALSPGSEDEGLKDSATKTSFKRFRVSRKVAFAVAGVIAVLGLIFLIVGIVLIANSKNTVDKQPAVSGEQDKEQVDKCSFSAEAKRAG